MTLNAVLIAAACGVAVLAICALIFLLTLPKRVKMVWFGLSVAEKVLKMTSKYKKGRKRR